MKIASEPSFDYRKELKDVMKEYKRKTQGKTKEEQREMRKENEKLRNLYYKNAFYKITKNIKGKDIYQNLFLIHQKILERKI